MRSTARLGVVLAVLLLLGTACRRDGVPTGDALDPVYGTLSGVPPLEPAGHIGWLGLWLHNVSDAPIVIERVEPNGEGVGTIVRVEKMQASPNLGDSEGRSVHGIWGGIFTTDPPVASIGGICHWPELEPLRGSRLEPDGEMRVWMVLTGIEPGRFHVRSHTVYYRQEGTTYREVVPIGYAGRVEATARPLRHDPTERPCLKMTSSLV